MSLRFILKNYKHWIKRLVYRKSKGGSISIGRYTYGAPMIRWWGEPANLSIGSYCSIADNVEIFLGGNHRIDWVSTYPFPIFRAWPEAWRIEGHPGTKGDIKIGNDVWLGSGSVILSGVTIGDGAVVGCRSVVTRNVPDYAIVAGNPAKIIRMRFDSRQINKLIASAWWDWDPPKVRANVNMLLSSDVDGFLRNIDVDL
jgi:acetyltransferase-like isoleucine patch superfamily enzyme